jgi:hypothetical protein
MNSHSKNFCCELFKKLNILPPHFQYIFSVLLFVFKNSGLFKTKFDVNNFSTRSNYDLHHPTAKLTIFQNGFCFSGTKFFNIFPLLSGSYHMTSLNLNQL